MAFYFLIILMLLAHMGLYVTVKPESVVLRNNVRMISECGSDHSGHVSGTQ